VWVTEEETAMTHSKELEETVLWKEYEKKASAGSERCTWVKNVYEYATDYLKDVRRNFENYTLHDETHILNVMDAMGGLLGDQISNLSVGELEVLILVASLHDIGMVYTDEEKNEAYEDAENRKKFLREYYPEALGSKKEEWTEDMWQWYLRNLHSWRVAEVLNNRAWNELISQRPLDIVPLNTIVTVCEAHGYNPSDMVGDRRLDYLPANDVSPLFCTLLLRLGDLLDFDDTRAPKVLYSYVECNEKSSEEWRKHQASAGFFYPTSPSVDALPYRARCTNPGVEHAVRNFLDWVDDELGNCAKLQKRCEKEWQHNFPFPRSILRNEIESDGYVSGDFCITMDQTKILELLTGENLYDNRDVFVRELLQNAIDATLLRGKMDPGFTQENYRIDCWEWNDKDGNIWFRIDDKGTGMTTGMLQRYFLRVGNSYYSSKEIERDLRDHNQNQKYQGISRFGIGFLSCFLNGEYAEVSTLYFDPEKNRREEGVTSVNPNVHYGLRLQVTGLSGYYTLLDQSKNHLPKAQMPKPELSDSPNSYQRERAGYRMEPGTSVVIRLNPGKLGTMDLKKTVKKYLCGSRVPVYYNNERIGQTYEEVMEAAHAVEGEKVYELTDEMKEKFDCTFPEARGTYPKIVMNTIPLDTKEDCILQGVSGVFVKYDVRFEKKPCWKVKDLDFEINTDITEYDGKIYVELCSSCMKNEMIYNSQWDYIKERYSAKDVEALVGALEECDECPQSESQLGVAWEPFRKLEHLSLIWKRFYEYKQRRILNILLEGCGCPNIISLDIGDQEDLLRCAYQGVYVGDISEGYRSDCADMGLIFLEKEWRPTTQANRAGIIELPIEVGLYLCGAVNKYKMGVLFEDQYVWRRFSVRSVQNDWKVLQNSLLQQWLECSMESYFKERINFFRENIISQNDLQNIYIMGHRGLRLANLYQDAYLQKHYQMKINYVNGQSISSFEKKEKDLDDGIADVFPPMRLCKAANVKSREYLCSADPFYRKGITLDHSFMEWLVNNAFLLDIYYQRQFRQILSSLCFGTSEKIMFAVNKFRQQLISLPEHHGVDVKGFPRLSKNDFWIDEENDTILIE
jgi:hypothetical protein